MEESGFRNIMFSLQLVAYNNFTKFNSSLIMSMYII